LPFFPEKFFADAAHLSWEERGAYLILLSHAWVRGGSLPNDDRQLRLLVGCGIRKWHAMSAAVLSFWKLAEDGRWHQKRLDEEWQRANARLERVPQSDQTQLSRAASSMAKKRGFSTRARPHDPTPTPTEKNSALIRAESSSLAPASLRVLKAHASPALRLVETTEPSPPPDSPPPLTDERRDQIVAECLAALHNMDDLEEPASGTKAEIERQAAEEKLAALEAAAEKPILALSPTTRASRLIAYELHANSERERAQEKLNAIMKMH
jgi:uncharacterized protein YdaU (DUF1376 family)